jgi:hypothetical protein
MLHYAIHGVEMLYTLLGPGCTRVHHLSIPEGEVALGLWGNGHIGAVRGLRDGQGGFGFAAHYERGHYTAIVEGAQFYTEMLKAIVGMFETGVPPIDLAETREIMAFTDAAARSAASGATATPLSP